MKWRISKEINSWLPRLQAHRGYWVEGLQQNSLKSVQGAYQKKYKMAEFDVRLTKDHTVILFHDDRYQGRPVEQYLFRDFMKATRREFPDVATLDEVLSWLSQKAADVPEFDFRLNIEIK